ncbi:TKL/TKL-ccin protein kinase [Ephemerocybe angulata]|uniref:TKL/TKL-ccin protein kinase n=1 Tax=Ephemerocybe angulata TaxID=980116 RepID=A0A8H6MFV8_9AGAR|nr:TKL/TKL-ccin protein kinase [Tulosesus angulatus]
MAHQRRSPQHRTPTTTNGLPPSSRRAYPLRRTHSRTSSHALSPQSISSLLPHNGSSKDTIMRESNHPVQVGAKRKRVASSNENAHNHGRPTRSSQKRKRTSTTVPKRYASTSEESESEASEMELDPPSRRTDDEVQEEEDEGEDGADSTDDYLLYSAPHARLNRLKKGDLVRLYNQGGLPEDPELLTKAEIIEVIIDARQDAASSDYSSDEGNVAGDEDDQDVDPEVSEPPGALRRRATMLEIAKTPTRPLKGRSMSLGTLLHPNSNHTLPSVRRKASLRIVTESSSRQRSSVNRSSPSTSALPSAVSTTRLRSRKVSGPTSVEVRTPSSAGSRGKGKGKSKQVEFIDDVVQPTRSSSRRHSKEKERERERMALAEESDLTELSDLENHTLPTLPQPSPRRLRSKDRDHSQGLERDHYHADAETTPTPKKKGKGRTQPRSSDEHQERPKRNLPMREEEDELEEAPEGEEGEEEGEEDEEGEGDEGEEEDEERPEDDEEEEGEEEEEDAGEELEVDIDEENEVDELVSIASQTPPLSFPENEGDDELEVEEEDVDIEDAEEAVEDDEETIAVEEPRRLRNGKIVGDDDVHMDEDEETAEEDVDLTVATAKTLTRLRKDDLVRLCETRNLEPVGNKRKLAEALLQWRDRHTGDFSSPSSTGTVRPPSTTRKGRKTRSSARTTSEVPVLLRSHRDQIHTDEPRTPIPGTSKDKEEELELDLESLGLEDREIPPEKILKLEKIGSGGFKDVFIGKFKGRRIAISEFRGTLSAMDIKELKLLGGFDHPNIVRFLGVSIPENTKETPVMIVSELCSNGDLFDYVRNVNAPTLHKVLRMMLDIAAGLEYLHTRTPSVIHRDCKSSNILITAKGIAKIADFGLAKVKESTRSMVRSLVGTVNWQAPELRPNITGLRKQWCPEIVDLVERMWSQEPRDRPTMSEVVTTLRELVSRY